MKLGKAGVGSNISINDPLSLTYCKSYLVIICPNSHDKFTKI